MMIIIMIIIIIIIIIMIIIIRGPLFYKSHQLVLLERSLCRLMKCYSLISFFLCFTTNQFAQKFKILANLIIYYVNICNIY